MNIDLPPSTGLEAPGGNRMGGVEKQSFWECVPKVTFGTRKNESDRKDYYAKSWKSRGLQDGKNSTIKYISTII
jgi:hypothetical protein